MGNTAVRRYINQIIKWSDKTAPRHKHSFTVEACVELLQEGYVGVSYYHVMKCEKCNSFRGISKQGAVNGYVPSKIDGIPLITLYKSHKTLGFEGAEYVKTVQATS